MSGAIALSAMAALRTGSGLVTAVVPDRCLETVAGYHPAVMTVPLADDPQGRFTIEAVSGLQPHLSSADAIGCGPGMTTQAGTTRIVERLLEAGDVPRVLDADGINALSALPDSLAAPVGPLVLTPHPGEFARLSGVSAADREANIRRPP